MATNNSDSLLPSDEWKEHSAEVDKFFLTLACVLGAVLLVVVSYVPTLSGDEISRILEGPIPPLGF